MIALFNPEKTTNHQLYSFIENITPIKLKPAFQKSKIDLIAGIGKVKVPVDNNMAVKCCFGSSVRLILKSQTTPEKYKVKQELMKLAEDAANEKMRQKRYAELKKIKKEKKEIEAKRVKDLIEFNANREAKQNRRKVISINKLNN